MVYTSLEGILPWYHGTTYQLSGTYHFYMASFHWYHGTTHQLSGTYHSYMVYTTLEGNLPLVSWYYISIEWYIPPSYWYCGCQVVVTDTQIHSFSATEGLDGASS
jgi:hypothetical protein